MDKPKGFEDCLSDYGVVIKDVVCDEPVAWGFKLEKFISPERFAELKSKYRAEFIGRKDDKSVYAIITNILTRDEAIQKYGEITDEEFGVRGGWKSVTFGRTKFIDDRLRSDKKKEDSQPTLF